MRRIAQLGIVAAIGALTLVGGNGAAAPQQPMQLAQAAGEPEPLLQNEKRQRAKPQARPRPQARPKPREQVRAQARVRPQARPRARIVVRPQRYPYRRYHSIYPTPDLHIPAPRAVRHCENHYEVDLRPSGGVVVPRMRCWWVPG
jgi:hypothetical protein